MHSLDTPGSHFWPYVQLLAAPSWFPPPPPPWPVQAYDEGPWPRMTAQQRSSIMHRMADLLEVGGDARQWPWWRWLSCFRLEACACHQQPI